MSGAGWTSLLPLAEATRLAAETRLAEWRRREAGIEAALARIDHAAEDGAEDETLRRAGADLRWQAWCAARRTALLSELAQVRYRRAAAEEAMRHAAARAIAVATVTREERADALRLRARRAEREGRD